MIDPRWARLSRWVRERERTISKLVVNERRLFMHSDAVRAEVFKAVKLVMEMETRKWRREQRRTRP